MTAHAQTPEGHASTPLSTIQNSSATPLEADDVLDVLIVGGGPAGMSAALMLGRARKNVVVVDEETPRHAPAEGVHGFLSREGIPPMELRRVSRAQLTPFASVAFVTDRVDSVEKPDVTLPAKERILSIRGRSGQIWRARTLLLTVGVVDIYPEIDGFERFWAKDIHLCPYCHGWEVRDEPLAVLGHDEMAIHLATLLKGWSRDIVLLTQGQTLSAEAQETLVSSEVRVVETPVAALEGESRLSHIALADGSRIERSALFIKTSQRMIGLVESMGLKLNERGFIQTDMFAATSDPNIFAAGDCTGAMPSVLNAAAQGSIAGAGINFFLTLQCKRWAPLPSVASSIPTHP